MLLDKTRFDNFLNAYNRRLYQNKTIPSLFHPVPITAGIHVSKIFWKGGFSGLENAWHLPQNWSTGRVPTQQDWVVISSQAEQENYFPMITQMTEPIAQLEIKKEAELNISIGGQLTIAGNQSHSFGLINLGTIINEGVLNIQQTKQFCIHNLGLFINENELWLDKTIKEGIRESEDSSFVNCGEILEMLVG